VSGSVGLAGTGISGGVSGSESGGESWGTSGGNAYTTGSAQGTGSADSTGTSSGMAVSGSTLGQRADYLALGADLVLGHPDELLRVL